MGGSVRVLRNCRRARRTEFVSRLRRAPSLVASEEFHHEAARPAAGVGFTPKKPPHRTIAIVRTTDPVALLI
jgi:hypothetical protein